MNRIHISLAAALLATVATSGMAQSTVDSTRAVTMPPPDSTKPAVQPEPAPPPPAITAGVPVTFSSLIMGNFQYRGDETGRSANKFEFERAYITFRANLGSGLTARFTGDVYQQQATGSDAYYRGWALRAKYAYFQYDFLKGRNGLAAGARVGMIQTAFIETAEQFWPRWLSQVAVERAGFFSSADIGAAGLVTLPNSFGEVYVGALSGPGYTSRETDRFKDFNTRVTLTPFSSSPVTLLKKLTLVGWTYQGATASAFVNGGTGQVGPVGDGLARNRWGVFAATSNPIITIGTDLAYRTDERETGANTAASPRVVTDSTGGLFAAFALLRPFRLFNRTSEAPIRLVARYDRVRPNVDTDPNYHTVIGGLIWDMTRKGSVAFDYQEQTPHDGPSIAANKMYFVHWMITF